MLISVGKQAASSPGARLEAPGSVISSRAPEHRSVGHRRRPFDSVRPRQARLPCAVAARPNHYGRMYRRRSCDCLQRPSSARRSNSGRVAPSLWGQTFRPPGQPSLTCNVRFRPGSSSPRNVERVPIFRSLTFRAGLLVEVQAEIQRAAATTHLCAMASFCCIAGHTERGRLAQRVGGTRCVPDRLGCS